jgi:NAD(P)H-hydrate repair Nnr-like enzyme with NAD(P)H-hydrate dehydratase domain
LRCNKPDVIARDMPAHCLLQSSASGSDKSRILGDPEAAVLDAARRWNAVVLKDAITFIGAPDGWLWRHEGGNIGLATSGSADVLSGLITGFVARGATIEQASAWGVALHEHAGSALAARVDTLGYLAREFADEVPTIMQALMRKPRRPMGQILIAIFIADHFDYYCEPKNYLLPL